MVNLENQGTNMIEIPYSITPKRIITSKHVQRGYDIEIITMDEFAIHPQVEMGADGKSCTLHIRSYTIPRIGQLIRVGKRFVKVADTRFDHEGNLQVLDEDTKVWIPYDA